MKRRKNKKAVELNVTTIIVVILAVLALVIIALSFTGGMAKLWEQITGIWGGQSGIEESVLIETCNLYVSTNNKYNFCCDESEVRGRENYGEISCERLYEIRGGDGFSSGASGFCSGYECPA